MAEENRLTGTSAFHLECAVSDTIDASRRLIRGIELLDLEMISNAGAKLDTAEKSLLAAIRLRKEGN